jgi:hypothetical protein
VIGRDGRIQYVGHLADARLDAALRAARTAAAPAGSGEGSPAAAAAAIVQPELAPLAVGSQLPSESARTIDGRRFHFLDAHDSRLRCWCSCHRGANLFGNHAARGSANCRRMRERWVPARGPVRGIPGGSGWLRGFGQRPRTCGSTGSNITSTFRWPWTSRERYSGPSM